MSTNYYFVAENKEFVEKYFPGEYYLTDTPKFGYEVHIGKRSCGWKPLGQWHENAYKSAKEMIQFLNNNLDKIEIYDEYHHPMTVEDLIEKFINWADNQEIRYMKYIPEGVPDEIFGGRKYLVESTKDDYDITIPYDHQEYEKIDPYDKHWRIKRKSYYIKDEDGFNFMEGDFC